jgi:hypothetical protein
MVNIRPDEVFCYYQGATFKFQKPRQNLKKLARCCRLATV